MSRLQARQRARGQTVAEVTGADIGFLIYVILILLGLTVFYGWVERGKR